MGMEHGAWGMWGVAHGKGAWHLISLTPCPEPSLTLTPTARAHPATAHMSQQQNWYAPTHIPLNYGMQ